MWIKNNGEIPPGNDELEVFAILSNGVEVTDKIKNLRWSKDGYFSDILKWKLTHNVDKELEDSVSTTGDHYKGFVDGKRYDLVSHWQRTNSVGTARAKIVSQIERYCSRYGLKDDPLTEASKILDYATRLVEWEVELAENNEN